MLETLARVRTTGTKTHRIRTQKFWQLHREMFNYFLAPVRTVQKRLGGNKVKRLKLALLFVIKTYKHSF